jgi:hypothetical protein
MGTYFLAVRLPDQASAAMVIASSGGHGTIYTKISMLRPSCPQVLTGLTPYTWVANGQAGNGPARLVANVTFIQTLGQAIQLVHPSTIPFAALCQSCVEPDADVRPTFPQVITGTQIDVHGTGTT